MIGKLDFCSKSVSEMNSDYILGVVCKKTRAPMLYEIIQKSKCQRNGPKASKPTYSTNVFFIPMQLFLPFEPAIYNLPFVLKLKSPTYSGYAR